MEPGKFRSKVDEIGRAVEEMGVAVIIFNDGERHVTQTWTIQEGTEVVRYQDVHCAPNSTPIEVAYRYIKDVVDYSQLQNLPRVC